MTAFLIIRNKACTRAHVLNLVQAFLFGCVLRVLCMLAVLLLTATASRAQQFAAEWMTVPNAADSHCQWVRHTFVADSSDRLRRASVCVATDSRFVLYVNGRNVSTSLFMPGMVSNDIASTMADNSKPVAITYDVSRFLRPDSNTVALLVAPEANSRRSPSVAVGFFGTTVSHQLFARQSAEGWMCHESSTLLTPEGEMMDGRSDALSPAYGDMVMAQWCPVVSTATPDGAKIHDLGISAESLYGYNTHGYNPVEDNVARVVKILFPQDMSFKSHSAVYRFASGFYGIVRVTLRGCRRGERISIGGLDYVCSGEFDEQAYSRFSPLMHGDVVVEGDQWFRPEQIQQVEAICMK